MQAAPNKSYKNLLTVLLMICFMALPTSLQAQLEGTLSCDCPANSEEVGQTYTYLLSLSGENSQAIWDLPEGGGVLSNTGLTQADVRWTETGTWTLWVYVKDAAAGDRSDTGPK